MRKTRAYGKFISFLLLLVFSSIQVVEAVHYHERDCQSSLSRDGYYSDSRQASFEKLSINCDVCEYFLHKESKQLHTFFSVVVVFLRERPVTLTACYTAGIPQKLTDNPASRGPPSVA